MQNKGVLLIKEYEIHVENTLLKLLVAPPLPIEQNKEMFLFTPHTHDSTELFACENGEINIKIKSQTLKLNSGDIAIIPSGIKHIKEPNADNSKYYVLNFMCTQINNRDCNDLYHNLIPFVDSNKIIIIKNQPQLFEYAQKIYKSLNFSDDTIPPLLMVEFLIEISKVPYTIIDADKESVEVSSKSDIARGYQLDHLIAKYYNKKISANELAEQLHICVRQLDRFSKKRYGKTIHNVFMEKRVQTAESLLRTTDMTNEQIAIHVGFNSCSGLYREFYKHYGITPSEYRKKAIY